MTRPPIGVTSLLLARIRGTQLLLNEVINMPKLNNEQELENWSDDTDRKMTLLATSVEKQGDLFNLNFNDHKDVNSESYEASDYRLAKYFHAVMRGDKAVIADMGGTSSRNFTRDKSDLGTPLTGDDSGTVASYGIPTRLYGDSILRYANTTSEIIPQLRKVTMAGRLIRWPIEGSVTADLTFVTNEVADKTEHKPALSFIDLECETFAGWVGVTDEFMEDTFVDIGAWIRQMAGQSYIDTVEAQCLTATSPFTGCTQYTSNVDYVSDSVSFDGLSWADLRNTKNALTTKRLRQRCAYVMHPTVWDIFASMQDGSGKYYYDPARSPIRSCWGYPVYLSDSMPDEDDSSTATVAAVFGPLDQIILGSRMGMELKYFSETMYAVQDDENFFRYRTRFGVKAIRESTFAHLVTAAS